MMGSDLTFNPIEPIFDQVQGEEYPTVETFMSRYRLDAPAALGSTFTKPDLHFSKCGSDT